jgi:formylglycine-generating enzyme required for sulfatase activity
MADARRALTAFALAAALALPAAAQAPSWPEDGWNPRRAADDLVLPLPCGGAMAFRPIPVPVPPGALADREVTLGQPDQETATQEFLRRSFLAGGFPGPRGADPPRFFIAKYEVTRDQWAAVMAADCPALPTPQGRLPQAEITFAEAVEFTTRLSAWLTRNARDRLPRVEEAVAFARLPTEDEWEYAARGGAAVSEAEFGDRAYPMPDGILAHEFFQGARSADRQARPVGSLRPNPLSLHDMLGNVAEWTLESFRLNKAGRPHGLAGGQVARGGSFLRPEDEIRAAMREEFLPVDSETGAPRRMRHVGVRPVLARGTTTSAAQFQRLTEAFEQESRSRTTTAEDPLRLLDLLQAEATDPAQRSGIERVRATLQSEARARRDQESAALRGQVTAAVYLARQIGVAIRNAEVFAALGRVEQDRVASGQPIADGLTRLSVAAGTAEMRARLGTLGQDVAAMTQVSRQLGARLNDEVVPTARRRIAELAQDYLSLLTTTARSADRARLGAEAGVVVQQFEARSIGEFGPVAQLVARHLGAVAAGRTLTQEEVLRDLGAPVLAPVRAPPAPAAAPPRR